MITADRIWKQTRGADHTTLTVDDARWKHLQKLFQKAYQLFAEQPTLSPELVRLVRRVGFRLATLPLPANHQEIWGGEPAQELVRLRQHLFDGDADVLHELADALEALLSGKEAHPLWKCFLDELPNLEDPISIVTLRTTSISAILNNFQSSKQVSVLPMTQLPHWYSQSTTIVFGPPSAYPDWLKLFPPSNCLWIYFSWNKSLEIPAQLSNNTLAPRRMPAVQNRFVQTNEHRDSIAIDGIAPRWDENAIAVRVQTQGDTGVKSATVLARAALLANGMSILISAEPNTFTYVFDPYTRKVHRRDSNRLIPGMFIIGRESGSKDHIRSIVDNRILQNAAEIRTKIDAWKNCLDGLISKRGLDSVVDELHNYGVIVEPQTVHLWRTELIHGPSKPEWLEVLFEIIGMKNWQEHWLALVELRRAGQRAGQLVRMELLEQAESVDYEQAQTAETLRFTLDGVESGGLTAHRLEELGANLLNVPAGMIGEIVRS